MGFSMFWMNILILQICKEVAHIMLPTRIILPAWTISYEPRRFIKPVNDKFCKLKKE